MGEYLRFAHFSSIPTVYSLIYVGLKVSVGNIMIATCYHSAEVAPKALYAVGEDVTVGVFLCAVGNNLMVVAQFAQTVVCAQLVGNHP